MTHSPASPAQKQISWCIRYLQTGYRFMYPSQPASESALIAEAAAVTLGAIAAGDAAYHNVEHTIQVVLVGQEILQGIHRCDTPVTPSDWLHFILALLCHDVGYRRGVCQQDQPDQHRYDTGRGSLIELAPTATDASLTPVHVDRSQQFVQERFTSTAFAAAKIDVERLQAYIELTRFPVPKTPIHANARSYPGLARAADLLGQLGDSGYLAKLPALFQEFKEVGSNRPLGCYKSQDLRSAYPKFYWNTVSPYVQYGIRYLEVTQTGRAILENLYHNLSTVEDELVLAAA